MKYYVYFDAYGHARQIVSEQQLAEKYDNEPAEFLSAMCREKRMLIRVIQPVMWGPFVLILRRN